jgi:hypothetical protein
MGERAGRLSNSALRAVLTAQIDDGSGDALSEERVREVLEGRGAFTAEEKRRLWTAPIARRRYLRLRREAAELAAEELERRGVALGGRVMAAASDAESDVVAIGDSALRVLRHPKPGRGWILILQLSPAFREALPAGLGVRLADTGGRTWLQGQPNEFDEVHGVWDEATSPLLRLHEHRLTLRPN